MSPASPPFPFFFFNDTATTEIYTLSLHDALPICQWLTRRADALDCVEQGARSREQRQQIVVVFADSRQPASSRHQVLGVRVFVAPLADRPPPLDIPT